MGTTTSDLRKQANTIYKIPVDKLSAIQSVFSKDQLQLLHQATPDKHIHQFPGNAGAKANLPFVTGGYMKHMLDRLTGGLWSFEVKEKGNTAGQIWVLGRVNLYRTDGTIMIFKEQFGRADIKIRKGTKDPVDIGNDMKAAATDALKKCASELGIARDVYAANEFIEADIIDASDVDDIVDIPEKEAVKPAKVDEDYKTYVTELLLELYPATVDRMRFITSTTSKINLGKLTDYDWQFICGELEAQKLAKAIPEEE